MEIRVTLTEFGVKVRLRLRRTKVTKFIIIVLRTRSVSEMRMRAKSILETRMRSTNMAADAERLGVEVPSAALMTVVLVVSAIGFWLDKVIYGSVMLIFLFLLRLVRHVVGLLVRHVKILFAINIVFETKLLLTKATANKALKTTKAIA